MQEINLNKFHESCVRYWGENTQYVKTIEECNELCNILAHLMVGDDVATSDIIDEIADVTIMVSQLRWMFGEPEVDKVINKKREQLIPYLQQLT